MDNWKPLMTARQRFPDDAIDDVRLAVARELAALDLGARIAPGCEVAITAGSRGIDRVAEVLRATVDVVRALGARPFVVTAMGSHGNATAAGQREVLGLYGIDETVLGCEIRATMEVVRLGTSPSGLPLVLDAAAARAAAIVVVNRVKAHSILTGDLGSGLCKMTAVGLGNRTGAEALHQAGLQDHLVEVAEGIVRCAPVVAGLALVENPRDRLALIEGVTPSAFAAADRRLLAASRARMPRIPFDAIDVLVVERIGKNISGAGMDPNVIGMWRRNGGEPDNRIRRIVALELTPESRGNAIGVGMADVITERLRAQVDPAAMLANALTSNFLAGIKLPIAAPDEAAAIALALRSLGTPPEPRIVHIRDTAHLETLAVSPALVDESRARGLEIVDETEARAVSRSL